MFFIRYDDDKITIDEAIQDCLSWNKKTEEEYKERYNTSKSDYLETLYELKSILSNITYAELRLIYVCRSALSSDVRSFERLIADKHNAVVEYRRFLQDLKKRH